MKKYVILCFGLTIVFGMEACDNRNSGGHSGHSHTAEKTGHAQVDALKAEVLAVHDSVMPQMETIVSLKALAGRQLKALDSLTAANPKQPEPVRKQQLDSLIVALDAADESMMQWMQQFDSQMAGKTEEEKVAYLKSEKARIEAVRSRMLTSIAEGQKLLKP